MKKIACMVLLAGILVSCKNEKKEKAFEVSGTVTNNDARMIYLDELPMATMKAVVVDSAGIGKDGKFTLHAGDREARVFNLRLEKSTYPFAAVINDEKKVTVDVIFSKENNEFPEKYEVKGSVASQQMKDFMSGFNGKLQAIFINDQELERLKQAGAPDSAFRATQEQRTSIAKETRALFEDAIKRSNNPALTMFALGYYQTMANNPNYQLTGLNNDELKKIVGDISAKFPAHTGLAAINRSLSEPDTEPPSPLMGTTAPEIILPDVKGKTVKLSSFRGKYVLVDFWASWCPPCRKENPNLVQAWNKFKSKNFAILGVSLDKPGEKEQWTRAIMEDHLTWTHISDLQWWQSAVIPLYNINGIPYNVLVDPDGKIVAEKLFGSKLEQKLEEVLK